jgi:hypothetical protein
MAKFRVPGRAPPREDARAKVTGEAHFTAAVNTSIHHSTFQFF